MKSLLNDGDGLHQERPNAASGPGARLSADK